MCTHPERQIGEWNPWERSECVERANRVAVQVGQAVNIAVERFVTVGESIASDVPDLRDDMFHACNQARAAGSTIEKLCDSTSEESLNERTSILRAARSLLNSVTRVLLLADVVIVKQLLFSKDKNTRYVGRLNGVTNFTEFVKAFSQFGAEMVELSHLAGDRTTSTKEQRRKAQIAAAKQVLDRSTMLLLTSSKACLRHPDSTGCRENRDTIFCQMRRAMDLIHYVIKDGLCDMPEDLDTAKTVSAAIHQFESLVEMTRLTFITASTKESLSEAAESIFEQTQDFTDSAYTTHEHRESILVLCAQVKFQLDQLLEKEVIPFKKNCELSSSPSDQIEMAVKNCLLSTIELKQQLIVAALDQTKELNRIIKLGLQIVTALCNAALSCDEVRTQHYSLCFTQHIEQIVEVCKALRHIADSEKHQISIRYTEINVRIYGPQIIAAAVTLIQHPSSKIAKENIDVFIEMWHLITGDIISFYDEVTDTAKIMNKYTSDKSLKSALQPTQFPKETNTKGTSMNDGEEKSVKWQTQETSTANNASTTGTTAEENSDIVKRAKSMSHMTYCMHQFTKGHGPLKTTQDLFTQAEYFAEEANRLYKVIRQFSYQVPVGSHKKELLEELDRIPTYVQQLQFTVKNPTVGKPATFTKVDSVINETNHMMNIITKVVSSCYVCANTYGLDLAGVSWEGGCGGSGGGDGGGRAQGDQSKGGSSSSSDQAI